MRITTILAVAVAALAGAVLTATAPAAQAEAEYWVNTFVTAAGLYRGGFLYAGGNRVFHRRRSDRAGTGGSHDHRRP